MDHPYKTGKDMYDVLGIGDAGCWARINNEYSTSVTIYDKRLHCYYGDVREGGTIIDKRPVFNGSDEDYNKGFHLVVSGPMLNLHLDNGMMQKVHGIDEPYDGMAMSFDYVSLDVYCQMWKEIGARIGVRRGNTVVWHDGLVEDIVPAELRWRR